MKQNLVAKKKFRSDAIRLLASFTVHKFSPFWCYFFPLSCNILL